MYLRSKRNKMGNSHQLPAAVSGIWSSSHGMANATFRYLGSVRSTQQTHTWKHQRENSKHFIYIEEKFFFYFIVFFFLWILPGEKVVFPVRCRPTMQHGRGGGTMTTTMYAEFADRIMSHLIVWHYLVANVTYYFNCKFAIVESILSVPKYKTMDLNG